MRTIALQRKEVHRTPLFWEFTHSAYPTAAGRKPLCGLLITDRRSIPCLHCLEIKMQNPITHGYFLMLCRSLRYTYTVQYIILSKGIAFFRALCEGCCLSQTLFCSQIESVVTSVSDKPPTSSSMYFCGIFGSTQSKRHVQTNFLYADTEEESEVSKCQDYEPNDNCTC